MDAEQVVIGCAADGGYALPLAVMLRSAVSRLGSRHTLAVYAVDAGLARDDRQRIERSLGERVELHWVAPERATFAGLPLWGRMPIATYDKLAIARWMPETGRRVIWLDADLLVLGDLAELWQLDLGGAILGATQDARVPTVGSRFGIGAYTSCGLGAADKYFNAGVMLIDLEGWRTEDVEGRALAYLRRHREHVYFWDQEALNAVLARRWTELAPCWNWSPTAGHGAGLPAAGADATRILHFSGNLKPWRYAGRGESHDLYYRDLDRTAWAGWRPTASWWASGIGRYEASPLRRFALPLERWGLSLLRAATLRYASAADLGTTHDPANQPARPS